MKIMPNQKVREISVVIPAYNEEKAVADQITAVQRVLDEHQVAYEVIVVDDGSRDDTARRASLPGVQVLEHLQNKGYGAALKTGIRSARYEYVAIIDADGTYPPDALPAMLDKAGACDMIVGARIQPNAHIPGIRKPAKWFLRVLAGYLAGRKIPDLNSGLRVMKKSVVERFFYILPSGFSFTTTITLSMLCNDYQVEYHSIDYFKRVGKSKIRPVDAYHFFLLILRTIVYFNPLKVFLPIGAVFFLTGFGKLVYDVYIGNLSETALLGLEGGLLFWGMGLLADQIAKVGLRLQQE